MRANARSTDGLYVRSTGSRCARTRFLRKRGSAFVSSVSHEMKTPLSSIRAYIELLVDGEADDDATREEFLGVINSQADRLQRLQPTPVQGRVAAR